MSKCSYCPSSSLSLNWKQCLKTNSIVWWHSHNRDTCDRRIELMIENRSCCSKWCNFNIADMWFTIWLSTTLDRHSSHVPWMVSNNIKESYHDLKSMQWIDMRNKDAWWRGCILTCDNCCIGLFVCLIVECRQKSPEVFSYLGVKCRRNKSWISDRKRPVGGGPTGGVGQP